MGLRDSGRRQACARGWIALVTGVLVVGGTVVFSGGGPAPPPPPAAPPLVVLVVIDTLRADHLSPYGYAVRPTTPALERWARSATVFEHAYSSSSWTLPAFASILTGRWPSAHRAGEYSRGRNGGDWSALDDTLPTLPETLGRAGYATAAIVNNVYLSERFGVARGFESYNWRNGTDSTWRPASESVDDALQWLREHPSRPRFLLLHLMEPHFSYRAPEGFEGRFRTAAEMQAFPVPSRGDGEIRAGIGTFTPRQWELVRAAYDEEIAYVDFQLARFFSELSARGLWDDALVVLVADHGEEFVDHGDSGHGRAMYDEVVRVPLFVWWRRAVPGRVDVPVSLVDLFPTLTEAVGVEPKTDGDGVSLVPLLVRRATPPERIFLIEQNQTDSERSHFGVIAWPHKLLVGGDRPRLFDLSRDPRERMDLAGGGSRLAARLRHAAEASIALAERSGAVARNPRLDEADREALRALGYIQ